MSEDDKEKDTPETEEVAPQGGTEPAAGPTGRVLDQEEIDSLLGFDAGDGNGVRELIKSAVVSYGRLPMLEVVFERLAEQAAASLRTLTSGPAEVTVEGSGSIRYGAYMGSIPSPALLAIFKAREWNNFGLMAIDADLAFGLLDVLLGGQSDPPSERPDPRPYTTIERDLIGQMAKLIVEDQAAAFQAICQVGFEIDHFETDPGFANIARAGSAAIMTRFNVMIGKSRGTFDIIYPHATLEPVRESLAQRFMGEAAGRDTVWEEGLAAALGSTDLPLIAVLDEQKMSLKDIIDIRVGETLHLKCGPDAEVEIRSGEVPLATGRLGRSGTRYAVRVERNLLNSPVGQKGAA